MAAATRGADFDDDDDDDDTYGINLIARKGRDGEEL